MKPLSTAPRLDSDQLQQHYSDCIKLSTENKINAKNAFGLHLLEYIETIISEKSDNFQVRDLLIGLITSDWQMWVKDGYVLSFPHSWKIAITEFC